jgi:glutathione S-transferase
MTEFFQAQWVANLKNASEDYKNNYVPEYYNILAHYYSQRGGPFLLGDRVTYADFAVYQSVDNDKKTGTLPVCDHCTVDSYREMFSD